MRVSAWRITKTRYASDAYSGKSASDSGGRWNSPGTRLVYAASSASLALLEVLVHIGHPPVLSSYSLIRASFDDSLALTLNQSDIPANWRDFPPPIETQEVGDRWVADSRSCVLSVPSVIVPHELSYLINPSHPDFVQIAIESPTSFRIDERLLGLAA